MLYVKCTKIDVSIQNREIVKYQRAKTSDTKTKIYKILGITRPLKCSELKKVEEKKMTNQQRRRSL
jgi:hypothetical protein